MDAKKLIKLISVIAALIGGGVGYDVLTGDVPAEPTREEAPAKVEAPKRSESVVVKRSTEKPAVSKGEVKKIVVKSAPAKPAKPAERKRCIFASYRDGEWVTGWGTVKKILPDDTVPPCHQRFLLVDPTGETLLIANNIDRWPRLADLHVGDIVEFKGEFKDGERGYLVHWTHPDTSGRRPGGYVRKGR